MHNHATAKLTEDLTSVRVSDRLAKIAVAFAGGRIKVIYGAPASTDGSGTIFLPSACRAVALGTFEADDEAKVDFERMTWAYVNHEMGHIDVEYKLQHSRSLGHTARVTRALFDLVPVELKGLAVEPGGRIVLSSELLIDTNNEGRYGRYIANEYGGDILAASRQFFFLFNASEDPRQERMVSSRWKGASEHLEYANEVARREWREGAKAMIAAGEDRAFRVFCVALLEVIVGLDSSWAGEFVNAQVDAVRDLVDAYRSANWTDAHGLHDAINFSLAVLGRVYRRVEPPEIRDDDGDDGDVDEPDGLGGDTPEDADEAPETNEDQDSGEEEEAPSNADNDGATDDEEDRDSLGDDGEDDPTPEAGDDNATPDDDEYEETEGSQDTEKGSDEETGDDESPTSDGGDNDDGEDDEGDGGEENAEGPGDCEDSGSDSDNSDEPGDDTPRKPSDDGDSEEDPTSEHSDEDDGDPLRVGSIIRPSGSAIRYKVTAVHPDGSVDADPISNDAIREMLQRQIKALEQRMRDIGGK